MIIRLIASSRAVEIDDAGKFKELYGFGSTDEKV
jgi:hypothetical protein